MTAGKAAGEVSHGGAERIPFSGRDSEKICGERGTNPVACGRSAN